jgi:hypothetical protein
MKCPHGKKELGVRKKELEESEKELEAGVVIF